MSGLGNKKIMAKMRDIKTAQLQQIIDNAEKEKSRATLEKIKQLASQLNKYAMQNDIISKNYSQFIKLPKEDSKEKEIFSDIEIEKLFRNDTSETAQIILILIYTGLRIGELFDIKNFNVKLKEGYIIGGSKTEAGRNRIVPINPKIFKYIKALYKENDEYLITNSQGSKKHINNFRNREYKPLLKELGIRELTPHSTRHTFASLAERAGIKPKTLQELIGHADFSTTANICIHPNISQLKDAINMM